MEIKESDLILDIYSSLPESYEESPVDADIRLEKTFREIVGALDTQCEDFSDNNDMKLGFPGGWAVGKKKLKNGPEAFELEFRDSNVSERLVFCPDKEAFVYRDVNGYLFNSLDIFRREVCLKYGLDLVRRFISTATEVEGGLTFRVTP